MAALRLCVIDHLCDQAGPFGDDRWGRQNNALWILDGATGLSPDRLVHEGASDAAWFVAALDEDLRRGDWHGSVRSAVEQAAAAVAARFRRAAANLPADRSIWPAACITLVRAREGSVDVANLGDCKLLFRGESGGVRSFGSSAINGLDLELVGLVKQLHAQGISGPAELWSRLVPVMRGARKLRNIAGGYWVLDAAGTGVAELEEATLAASEIREFLLMTDGFYRLVDTYHAHSDGQLLVSALARGLAALRDELRAIEANDARCMAYPRVKAGDDATAVLGRIERV